MELLHLALEPLDALRDLVGGDPEELGGPPQPGLLGADVGQRGRGRQGLDAPDVGADRALPQHLDRADHAEGVDVGAAAQLDRAVAGLDDPHDVAVLVAEEGDGADRLGVLLGRLVDPHRAVAQHLLVGLGLDPGQDLGRDGLVVGEVEPQPVGGDHRAGLLHVVAEHVAQGPVQEVGAGVVAAGALPAGDVDAGGGL